ncbi:DUF4340 domain-containing protein [Cerasicoccus arenae]|uniref:DUF4340 domain-containing protein n=1 Tax=Cerasicoccus arenae TaxID=424488 RepID=A0A8J3DI85_9BACT|nr:DUF4340 domain-containing protein [Cerasicoccus arenae]MBK1858408.1 DUF4340 domain-containing protein [Cerasicoccus arenae]GHC02351.1 hypothetical protein GCM10007047_18630 [Cerasicoccus arenae]
MRWKLTFLLLLLNVAAFYYLYYLENREDPREVIKDMSALVLPQAGDITGITLTARSQDGQARTRVLEKTRRGWQLTSPVKWPANENAVQKILAQLEFLEKEANFPLSDIEKSGQKLSDFGLDPAQFELVLTSLDDSSAKGKETRLEIGSTTGMGNRLYVMAPGGKEVLVVGDELLGSIAVPLAELRSQRIFDIPVFELESLTVQTTAQRIRLVKSSDGWSFETPVPAKADDQLVQNALALIVGQRVERLIPTGEISPELAGLTTPTLRITLGGNNRRQTLLLGGPVTGLPENTPPQLYARLENGGEDTTIFTVQKSPFEWLTRAQEELRERRILRFDPTKVSSLEINRAGKTLTLQRLEPRSADEPPAWQSVAAASSGGEVKTETAATPLVEQLIQQLNQMEVIAFVSDAPAPSDLVSWGLSDPVAQVTIRGARDWTLLLGNNISPEGQTSPPPWANPRNLYAKTSGKASVYAVDLSILGALRADSLAYRNRTLTSLPKDARVQSLTITDLSANKVLLEKRIKPESETWPTVLTEDDIDRSEILTLVDSLKDFKVKEYLLPEFKELPNLPWRYRLDADIILPGGDGSSEKRSYYFTIRDGIRQVGGSPRQNVTFLLAQPLIDALFPLTLEKLPPNTPKSPKEVLEAPLDSGAPRRAPDQALPPNEAK